jgi:hypothetical protein
VFFSLPAVATPSKLLRQLLQKTPQLLRQLQLLLLTPQLLLLLTLQLLHLLLSNQLSTEKDKRVWQLPYPFVF